MTKKLSKEAAELLPFIAGKVGGGTKTINVTNTGGGGGGGVSDHGDLTGLSDDDHTQYFNTTRGDARYLKLANKQHDVTDGDFHTTTADAGYVLGTSSAQTLAMLATTADGAVNHSTILKSNASGGLTLDSLRAPLLDTASGDLTLDPAGDLLISNDVTFASPNYAASVNDTTGFSLGPNENDSTQHVLRVGKVVADELLIHLLTADETWVRRATDLLTQSFGIIAEDAENNITSYTVPAENSTVNIWFHDSPHVEGGDLFSDDEWVKIQYFERGSGLTLVNIWGQVANKYTDGDHDNMQRWTFTNRTSGLSTIKLKPGIAAYSFGSSGDGWIERTVIDGGPRSKYYTWSGSNPRDGTNTLRVQLGDLTDVSGSNLDPSGYGLYGSNVYLEGDFYAAAGDVVMTADGTSWKADTVEASTWTDYGNKISWMVDPLDPVESEVVAQMWATRYTASSDTIGDWWLRVKAGGDSELTDGHIYITAENASYAALLAVSIDNNDPTVLISAGDSTGLSEYASINVGGRANEVVVQGDALSPEDDEGTDLGTATERWGTLYVATLNAGTEVIAGTITGSTWGDSANQAMYVDNDWAAADSTLYVRNTEVGRSAHLNVEGNGVFGGNISVGGTVDGVDIADLSTDFSSHQTSGAHTALSITNNGTIGGTLGVTGATTLSSTLGVTGTLTASGAATVGTTLDVTGVATFDDDANVGGDLDVTGASTIGGALGVTGTITGSDTISGTSILASGDFIGDTLRPSSDSTTAIKLANSSGTAVATVDTINGYVGVNTTPAARLHVSMNYSTSPTGFNAFQDLLLVSRQNSYAAIAINAATGGKAILKLGDPDDIDAGYVEYDNDTGLMSLGAETGFRFSGDLALGVATTPETILHINQNYSSEPTGFNRNSDLLLISRQNSNVAMALSGGTSHNATIKFGDTGDVDAGYIDYDNATDTLSIGARTAIVFDDDATASGDLDVTGVFAAADNATIGGTLGVTGATTLSSTLDVTGTLTADGAATVGTTLGVSGATTLSSTLAVTGAITASSTASIAGTVDVPQIDIKDGGTVYGRIDSTGITSVEPAFTSGDNAQGWKVTWDGHLTAREVTAVTLSSFVFEMRQVHAIGSTLIVTPAGRLNADATMPSSVGGGSTFQLRNPDGEEGQIFQVDDVVRITALGYGSLSDSGAGAQALNPALFFYPSSVVNGAQGLATAWLTITSATAADGYWTYGYDLSDGATSFRFPAGTAVVKWGQDGDGLIRISSDDYDGYTPYLSVSTVTSTPWTGDVDIIRLGRIDGLGQITGGQQYGLAISTDWTDATAPQFVASDVSGVYTKNLTQQWINDDGETAIYIDPDVGVNLRVFDNVVANSTLAWMADASGTPTNFGSSSSNVLFGLSCNIDTDAYTTGTPRLGPYARMAVHGQTGDTESTLVIQATTTEIESNGTQNQASSARVEVKADTDTGSRIDISADAIDVVGAMTLESVLVLDAETGILTVRDQDNGQGIFRIINIPVSSSGLASGSVYSDSGTLKIVS